MRTVRWMASGLALMALLPSLSAAQSGRLFEDSWFWGAKGGIMSFSTTSGASEASPSIGIDWLVTRSKGALYVSTDQAFFTSTSSVPDNTGAQHTVGIKDLRRYTAALLAAPVAYGSIHPYGGLGFTLNLIQTVSSSETFADAGTQQLVTSRALDQKDRASFILMAGAQAQLKHFSVFGQATYMPAKTGFLLNGRSTYFVEAGLRYNVGPAHDDP